MASEAEDSLYMEVELGLAAADAQFEAQKRRWEEPIKLNFEAAGLPGATRMGRTFGGQEVLTGDANYERPAAAAGRDRPTLQEIAIVQRMSTISASDLGGYASVTAMAMRPMPTASTNTVYGDTAHRPTAHGYGTYSPLPGTPPAGSSPAKLVEQTVAAQVAGREIRAAGIAAHSAALAGGKSEAEADVVAAATTRSLAAQRKDMDDRLAAGARHDRMAMRAEDAGFVGPLPSPAMYAMPGRRAATDVEIERAARAQAAEERGRAVTRRAAGVGASAAGPSAPGLAQLLAATSARIGGVYGAISFAQGTLGALNAYDSASAQAGADPYALARARIENDVPSAIGRSVPFVGGLGAEIYEWARGDRAAATRTLRDAEMGDRLSGERRGRVDLLRQAGNRAAVSDASRASDYAAEQAAFAAREREIEPNRQTYVRENSKAQQAQINAAIETLDAARKALPSMVVESETSFAERVAKDPTLLAGGKATRSLSAPGTAPIDVAAIPFTPQRSDLEAIKAFNSAVTAVPELRGKLTGVVDESNTLAADERRVIANDRANADRDRRRSAFQTTTASMLSAAATTAALSGNDRDALLAEIEAQYAPGILSGQSRALAAVANGRPQDLTPDLVAGIQSGIRGRDDAKARALTGYERNRIVQRGSIAATESLIAMDPLRAQLDTIDAEFQSATTTVAADGTIGRIGTDTEGYKIAEARRDASRQLAGQQYAVDSLSIGVGIATQREQTTALLARDPYSAEAAGIAGGAIGDAIGLFSSGRRGAANDVLANGIDALKLEAQQFGDGFEGVSYDVWNDARIYDSRNVIDPEVVFGNLNQQAEGLAQLAESSDGEFLNTANSVSGAEVLSELRTDLSKLLAIVEGWSREGN